MSVTLKVCHVRVNVDELANTHTDEAETGDETRGTVQPSAEGGSTR